MWHLESTNHMTHPYVTWLINMWHDSSIRTYVTWLININININESLILLWHDSSIRDMARPYVTWLIHTWHDPHGQTAWEQTDWKGPPSPLFVRKQPPSPPSVVPPSLLLAGPPSPLFVRQQSCPLTGEDGFFGISSVPSLSDTGSDTCTARWLELEKHPDNANKSDHANDAKQSCHAQKAGTQGVDHAMQYAESPPLDSGCCDLTYWYITWPLHTRYDLLIWPVTHSGGFFCTHCTHLL